LLFQVTETERQVSNNMEILGLIRCLTFLEQAGLDVSVIISDRHIQIAAWLKKNLPGTTHYFDVWHLAKSEYMHHGNKIQMLQQTSMRAVH
jgi:solute carrier family 8 (sodium/calcium exchanger)